MQRGVGGMVGERGPEWFVPSTDGTIIPNDRLGRGGGGGGQPITVNVQLDYAATRDLLTGRSASTTTRTASN